MKDHFDIEEDYHALDRKGFRKERRRAQATDRSQFKKTDLSKKDKSTLTDAEKEKLSRGRVLAIMPDGAIVDADGALFTCSLKGALKKDKKRIKNLIAVGDFVLFVVEGKDQGAIVVVEVRRTILSRTDPFDSRKQQLVAANIDQVLITMSVYSPPLSGLLIDHYIMAACKGGMEPVIVINKIDLLETSVASLKEKELYATLIDLYRSFSMQVYPVSTTSGEGLAALKLAMRNRVSVFAGPSGVGKSSLINSMFDTDLAIGPVAEKTRRGTHTTTGARLLALKEGGFCIDTPGISSFGVWDLSAEDIREFYTDLAEYSGDCKFPDCTHLVEPKCGVRAALDEGKISPLRFASYSALMENIPKKGNF